MKYKAKYASEDEILAEVKAFYKLVGGEWVFQNEFEGLPELLNTGLAANRDKWKQEKEKAEADLKLEKDRADAAEKALVDVRKPGTEIITSDEKRVFEEYKVLGTVKDVQTKIQKGEEAEGELGGLKTEKEIRQLAKDTGVDEEALVDYKLNSSRGKDVTLGKEKRKVKVGTKEIEKQVLVVINIDKVNDKDVESKIPFTKYAEDNHYPDYLLKGLFSENVVDNKKVSKHKEFYVPSTVVEKVDDKKPVNASTERITRFNNNRSTRELPWAKKVEQ